MIKSQDLLNDLKTIVRKLEDDIRDRCHEIGEINENLRAKYTRAKKAKRTAETFNCWLDDYITQVAVAWVLGCVFVRFMEDNSLIDETWISGEGEKLQMVHDTHTQYFQKHPRETDREYLLHVFREVSKMQVVSELFDDRFNPVWRLGPSGDGASLLLQFFQKRDAATGLLVHNFYDDDLETRFLGDLYQDLSESARKRYALLQTPEFIEKFILDRTLTPAIDTFGLAEVRLIDPACGSGHFLLGAFDRLMKMWIEHEPAMNERQLIQRALNAVYGIDVNAYAIAIARFRLLIAALKSSNIDKLRQTPAFKFNLAVGDSLLHGPRPGTKGWTQRYVPGMEDPFGYVYDTEDAEKLYSILSRPYHTVVGNPPYITVKDRTLNSEYKNRFASCYGKYSLVCPFMERFFDLAIKSNKGNLAGFIGLIVANSFIKRQFGKKLVEEIIPNWDITHIIDASGIRIAGHGTPTLILFARNQKPENVNVRAVLGIKSDLGNADETGDSDVWKAILEQVDIPESESDFISTHNIKREKLAKHPWSLTGGGATSLKYYIDDSFQKKLTDFTESIGITSFTLEDDIYLLDVFSMRRNRVISSFKRPMIIGENIRDWFINSNTECIFPYDSDHNIKNESDYNNPIFKILWLGRSCLKNNKMFGGKTKVECGLKWYEFGRLNKNKLEIPLSICIAFVATHNHFVLDKGGKVFNRSAPVIKLSSDAIEADHLKLLGVLNSSVALFWARQTLFSKRGDPVGKWGEFIEWDGTKLSQFPLPDQYPIDIATKIDYLGNKLSRCCLFQIFQENIPSKELLKHANCEFMSIRQEMIAFQEELDWQCYKFYQLTDLDLYLQNPDDIPSINLGERAFEIVMARNLEEDDIGNKWFERHNSKPVTEIPGHWSESYRRVVQKRIGLIERDKNIKLLEKPEYKRRWAMVPWEEQVQEALQIWLLNRIEYILSGRDLLREEEPLPSTKEPLLLSCAQIADQLRADNDFLQVAELYTDRSDFDVKQIVLRLIEGDSVPYLPIFRYKDSGLRKREDWERTWELQRQEDAINERTKLQPEHQDYLSEEMAKKLIHETIGDIPVAPRYKTSDFLKQGYWKLRGKLDVPKERFISYPGCEREADETLVITWAGWDQLQQAQALATYYEDAKSKGWSEERLLYLLVGLFDLLPWLKQWFNDIDPQYGIGMGDYFSEYVQDEARLLRKTFEDLKNWKP